MSALRNRLRLRTRLRQSARRVGWHLAPAAAFELEPRSFYSALVDLDGIPPSTWAIKSEMLGVQFDVSEQFDWAETHLAARIREFDAPRHGDPNEPSFFTSNGSFQTGDAEVTYAMIRSLKPRRVVELGSGFSTLVLAQAVEHNRRDGFTTSLDTFDPYPQPNVAHGVRGLDRLHRTPAQQVPVDVFRQLERGDVLFVDTTHTVKLGSEVNRIVLDVLPSLAPGVNVHFHDIWLPFEYSRELIEDVGHAWAEQYLLQAQLQHNERWRVRVALHAMRAADPARFARLLPRHEAEHYPTGFWIVSVDG